MIAFIWVVMFFQALASTDANVEKITIRNGLPSNYAKHVYAANNGNIWVSTDFGLSLLRGPKIQNFNAQFSSAFVKQVYRATSGKTYVIGNGDFFEIVPDGADFKFIPVLQVSKFAEKGSLNIPDRIYEDANETLWISERMSFSSFSKGKLRRFDVPERAHSYSVYRNFLFQDFEKNKVLISSHPGFFWIYDYETDSLKELSASPSFPDGFGVESLFKLEENRFLIGSELGVFEARMVGQNISIKLVSDLKQVIDIIFDREDGALLLATKSAGVYRAVFDENELDISKHVTNVTKIKSICLDDEGNLWVGSDEGVSIVSEQVFDAYELNTLDAFVGQSLVKNDSTFTISSKAHIYEVVAGSNQVSVNEKVRIPNSQITAIAFTGKEYFVGLLSGLVLKIDENGIQEIVSKFQNSISQLVWTDRLYVAQENSSILLSVDENKDITLFGFPEYRNPEILQITASEKNGAIYGVVRNDKYSIFRIEPKSNVPEILTNLEPLRTEDIFDVLDIHVSVFNRLWIATTQGIAIIDFENPELRPQWIDVGFDFPFQLIEDIKTDSERDRLWIGAQNGLFLYDEGILAGYAKDDGMLRDQITSLHLSPSGMILGHIDGFSLWNSAVVGKSKTYVNIELVSNNQATTRDKSDILQISRNDQEISVLAKSHPTAHITLFWRVENSAWKQVNVTNTIPVTSLQDGLQTVEIIAIKTGFAASIPVKFSVFVVPYWYNTSWFYLVALIGTLLILMFIVRFNKAVISQRRAITSLREVREQIQAIVQSSPVILISFTKEGRIQLLEGKALDALNVSPERYIGEHISMLFEGEKFENALKKVLEGKSQQFVIDRNSRSYDMHFIPLFVKNEVVAVNGIGVDISPQVQTERELRLAKDESEKARLEAERANRAKSQFLANMSHELRTPLNAIIGYSQILSADQQLSDRQHQFVEIMQSSGYHLLGMINDILDLSKIESGKLDVNNEDFSLSEILEELENMFRLQTVEKGLALHFTNNVVSLSTRVNGDTHKIRQILLNLISNAIKYTDKGFVSITLDAQKKEGDEMWFQISVQDSGRGIPRDQLNTIFRPFRQVKGLFNTGTGLGLTISKNLTELLGGTIKTSSEVGKGSTFEIRIPLKIVEKNDYSEFEKRNIIKIKDLEPPKLLVVDDIKSNRDLLKEMLLSYGFNVQTASSGKSALQLLYKEHFDLILLDLNMPDLQGEEVLSIIRKEFEVRIPIIAVTAQGFSDSKEQLAKLGFDDYVSKPFLWEDLLKSIHVVTDGKFTEETTETVVNDDFETIMKLPLSFINNLSKREKTKWKDALELIDLSALERLAAHENVPQVLRHAIKNKDFKYLLLLEEKIS